MRLHPVKNPPAIAGGTDLRPPSRSGYCPIRAEDDAGGGGVRVELVFLIENFSFRGSSATADVNDVRFATHLARLRGHWPDEVDLDFQRGVARACGKS